MNSDQAGYREKWQSGLRQTISAGIRNLFNFIQPVKHVKTRHTSGKTMAKGRDRLFFMFRESKTFVKVARHCRTALIDHDVTQSLDQYSSTLLAQHGSNHPLAGVLKLPRLARAPPPRREASCQRQG